jgi:NADPH-dependent glutamate synthase beta subunit-like oxidoreductase
MSVAPPNFKAWLAQAADGGTDTESSESSPFTNASLPVLVVGAGPAGLAVMGRLKQAGIAFEAAEKSPVVGLSISRIPHMLLSLCRL